MLANTISIDVNHDNDNGTTPAITEVFDRYEEYLNRSVYVHSAHTLGAKDILSFYRTQPKPAGTFKGMAKTAVKFTKDLTVADSAGGTITAPAIVQVSFSIPVGATDEEKLLLRQRVVALLCEDAIMTELQNKLMV